ncbi:MAG TPA: aminotransferase class I/II-fold pyridoxal phosphate-dependent enzyme [Planctomycetaceae bacterium]|jgi:dTDP-4-amino-4,6-dideoxygalactose transaminase|nr:aminotransferase class I/II-fold pyridoxal phosphate-dependent enzyme [Planctomycetaceae bacterium]
MSKLALFGHPPAFDKPLHVGRPNLPDKHAILERIAGALDAGWLTNGGPLVSELEHRLAQEAGVKHCVATSNGTAALELAIRALGLVGEVLVPAFTFIATAHALAWHGLRPVFCDVDPATHTLDPQDVARKIRPQTSAILGVHLWGRVCDIASLTAIAQEHKIPLLFDAAHAFGCTYHGRPIGGFGACETFSFHATKFVHCGEGGAVATNDDRLAERIRLRRNFGFSGYDRVSSIGTNAKMSELAAAVGLTSLDNLGTIVAVNRQNYDAYRRRLRSLPGLQLLSHDAHEQSNYQYIVLEVDPRQTGLSRDELVQVLVAENVLARRYFYPGCHRMEPYCSDPATVTCTLPVTESLADRVLALPTGMQLDESDVSRIVVILAEAIENAAAIRSRLGRRQAA